MVHLIPVPQIQEQLVSERGVHFTKLISTMNAMMTLFRAKQLSTSEFVFLTARQGCGTPVKAQATARVDVHTASHPPYLHDERIQCSFYPSVSDLLIVETQKSQSDGT